MRPNPKFSLGQVVATSGAIEVINHLNITPLSLLSRHIRGDWGELDDHDKQANDNALANGSRLLSSYEIQNIKLWVITEAIDDQGNRSATTILLPSEY